MVWFLWCSGNIAWCHQAINVFYCFLLSRFRCFVWQPKDKITFELSQRVGVQTPVNPYRVICRKCVDLDFMATGWENISEIWLFHADLVNQQTLQLYKTVWVSVKTFYLTLTFIVCSDSSVVQMLQKWFNKQFGFTCNEVFDVCWNIMAGS